MEILWEFDGNFCIDIYAHCGKLSISAVLL